MQFNSQVLNLEEKSGIEIQTSLGASVLDALVSVRLGECLKMNASVAVTQHIFWSEDRITNICQIALFTNKKNKSLLGCTE